MFLSSRSDKLIRHNKKLLIIAGLMFSSLTCSSSFAAQYNFVVQPIFTPQEIQKAYQPLMRYLSEATGEQFKIITANGFLAYWEQMKRTKDYHLILDAAHFTDYRIKQMNYTILAKIPETVSFSLITNENNLILDAEELIGKSIVTLPPPSLGAVRLSQMFPNPSRQPIIRSTASANEAVKKVQEGKCFAALVPTPILNFYPDVNIISTTTPVPHMAISASPAVPAKVQAKIRNALVNAKNTVEGQRMLKELKLMSFESASARTYKGYSQLLVGLWGY